MLILSLPSPPLFLSEEEKLTDDKEWSTTLKDGEEEKKAKGGREYEITRKITCDESRGNNDWGQLVEGKGSFSSKWQKRMPTVKNRLDELYLSKYSIIFFLIFKPLNRWETHPKNLDHKIQALVSLLPFFGQLNK